MADFRIRIENGRLVPLTMDELLTTVRTVTEGYHRTGLQAIVFTTNPEVRKIDVFYSLGKAEEEWGFTEPVLVEGPIKANVNLDENTIWRWVWEETSPPH